jgi:hypothetical protein
MSLSQRSIIYRMSTSSVGISSAADATSSARRSPPLAPSARPARFVLGRGTIFTCRRRRLARLRRWLRDWLEILDYRTAVAYRAAADGTLMPTRERSESA